MTRAVFGGLLAAVVLAPLPFASNRPWSWTLLSLIVGALLVLWAAAALRDRSVVAVSWHRVWPFVVCFAAIVVWIAVQASTWTPAAWHHRVWAEAAAALGEPLDGAISIDPEMTLVALMRLLAYAGVFWLALQLGRAEDRARAVVWTVACAGAAYSVYGLVIEFGGFNTILWYERWAYEESVTSTFVNRNSFATYAGLTLLAVLGLLFEEIRKGTGGDLLELPGLRWFLERLPGRIGMLSLMALTIGSALLLTDSRGGLVSFLAGLLVLGVGFVTFPGGRALLKFGVIAGFAAFTIAILALSGDVVLERLSFTFIRAEERPAVYALVIREILHSPWFGTGYGTFESAFPLIRDVSIKNDLIYDKAHNSYLEFAYEAGVPAFAVMMGLLGGLTALCMRGVWRRRHARVFPCIGVAATILVGTHALLDFSVQIPAVAITYTLLLGTACAQSWHHRSPKRTEGASAVKV